MGYNFEDFINFMANAESLIGGFLSLAYLFATGKFYYGVALLGLIFPQIFFQVSLLSSYLYI